MTGRSRLTFVATAIQLLANNLHNSPTTAFVVPSSSVVSTRTSSLSPNNVRPNDRSYTTTSTTTTTTQLHGLFDDDDNSETEIPPEIRDEIYAAEAATPAAQNRTQRIAIYVLLTFAGVSVAFFNAFLSDLRFGDGSPSTELSYYGFEWVERNWLAGFLFLNKIGGALGLLGAGLSGTLAEVEIRSRKENAEKIWTEMQRRRELKEKGSSGSSSSKYLTSPNTPNKKRKGKKSSPSKKEMTGKQKKRISALAELMTEGDDNIDDVMADAKKTTATATTEAVVEEATNSQDGNNATNSNDNNNKGILGTIQNFYEKADSMAASQALLLNKELEDRGIVDKITDETGLKVIGKEAASKLKTGEKSEDEKKE